MSGFRKRFGNCQAVEDVKSRMSGIVFWEKGEVETLGMLVSADSPCIVIVAGQNNVFGISVADPTQTPEKIEIKIASLAQNKTAAKKETTVSLLGRTCFH
jgi:hypothetical protein